VGKKASKIWTVHLTHRALRDIAGSESYSIEKFGKRVAQQYMGIGGKIIVLTVLHANMDIPSRLAELEPRLTIEAEMLLKQLHQSSKRKQLCIHNSVPGPGKGVWRHLRKRGGLAMLVTPFEDSGTSHPIGVCVWWRHSVAPPGRFSWQTADFSLY